MDLRIQAIHFDIADRLSDFINKKAERLASRFPANTYFEATQRVVKPETAMNKEALIKIVSPQHDDVVATKTADTFEEAVDLAFDAPERQLEKYKQKRKPEHHMLRCRSIDKRQPRTIVRGCISSAERQKRKPCPTDIHKVLFIG